MSGLLGVMSKQRTEPDDGRVEERYVLIMGVDRKGPVHILLDEGTFLVDRGDFLGMYPLVNGEELLEQVWALLPEP